MKRDAYDHSVWNDVTVSKAVRAVPGSLEDQPLFFSLTILWLKNQVSILNFVLNCTIMPHIMVLNYLNGHCMVSLLLSFPIYQDGKILYLSVPAGCRLWDKEKSKPALAAELAAQAIKTIGADRQVILLCDSWYPKAEAAALVEQFENLEMVCNARVYTVLYGLPPARTGKKGRPRKRGDRISLDGTERLVNLISLSYSAMALLPYSDETFSGYQSASAQETPYEIGQQSQADIILCSFGKFLETIKNCSILIKVVEDYILSGFRKFKSCKLVF